MPPSKRGSALALDEDGARAQQQGMAQAPETPPVKRVHIKTFGCQMNEYDSERMAEALGTQGYLPTEDAAEADLVILNTCHIREKAAEKVYSELGRMRLAKERRRREGRDTLIAVAGCVAQAEGQEIMARAPAVDLVVGPQSYHRLASLVAEAATSGKGVVATDFPGRRQIRASAAAFAAGAPAFGLHHRAGRLRQVLHLLRRALYAGRRYSRAPSEIVAEAERLAAQGVREITLLGQNVNAYHGGGPDGGAWTLARLLRRLAEVPQVARLRYTTSHPLDMDDELIALFGDEPKLMPYLHLPFQSGSDRILKAMNRRHTIADYEAVIGKVRAARPDIALSTDIIVGFPGETDRDFEETMALAAARALPRPSPSSTARGPERPRQASRTRCRRRRSTSACSHCRASSTVTAARSTGPWSGDACRSCSSARGGNPDRSPGVHPICNPSISRGRRRLSVRSHRLTSWPQARTVSPVS